MVRAFAIALLATLVSVAAPTAQGGDAAATGPARVAPATGTVPDDDTTRPTINEFLPAEHPLSDCLSSLPKPDCGSEARGGWAQTAVFAAILAGLGFIAWRIVAGARRPRRGAPPVTPGRPDATSVPADAGDDPAP